MEGMFLVNKADITSAFLFMNLDKFRDLIPIIKDLLFFIFKY